MPTLPPLETWLRPNRRALLFGMAAPAIFSAIGVVLASGAIELLAGTVWRILGGIAIVLAVWLLAALVRQISLPRIGYRGGFVLFYLQSGSPIAAPVELVEGFLLGQGPVAPAADRDSVAQTATVVARLSQRAEDWAHRDVKPSLGQWCDGYVTIRGTWCEPLDEHVVIELNRRLAEAKGSA